MLDYNNSTLLKKIIDELEKSNFLHLKNVIGSGFTFLITNILKKNLCSNLIILKDRTLAEAYFNDFLNLLGKERVIFIPSIYNESNSQIKERALQQKTKALLEFQKAKNTIFITYSNAVLEKVINNHQITQQLLTIKQGQEVKIDILTKTLFEWEFNKVDFVITPGEFSIRGGIIDIFSYAHENPFRVELFGNEVESIRIFDTENQLSTEEKRLFTILPNTENNTSKTSLLDFIPKELVLTFYELPKIKNLMEVYSKEVLPNSNIVPPEEWFEGCKEFKRIEVNSNPSFSSSITFDCQQKPQKPINKKFELLATDLKNNTNKSVSNYFACNTPMQKQRLVDILEDIDEDLKYSILPYSLFEGFLDPIHNIACYTDHQIFERYYKRSIDNHKRKGKNTNLQEISELKIGDYISHIDYGIGQFAGLKKIKSNDSLQEVVKIIYAENDTLYVGIHSLHKISKYRGKEGSKPKIHKLGSGVWNRLKAKTKKKVKQIAFDLISLYAKRRSVKNFSCLTDSHLQHELEGSFFYEDTPDQSRTTTDVKIDMEKEYPMDRLVCGDVGFGKTEIAIRAAFKAVDNGNK